MNFNIENNEKDSRSVGKKPFLCKQALAVAASCLISVSTGLTLGISSVMLPELRNDETIEHTPSHESWIASIASLSMIIGSLTLGPILDYYGRKPAHIMVGVPFILGWIIIACAKSTTMILVGRFFTGISCGGHRPVTMVYIGEISDPKYRAFALFLPGFVTPIGVLISHVFGYYFGWRISCIVFVFPAVVSSLTFIYLKESPLWMIAKGKITEGVDTFRWFRGTDEASELELETVLKRQCEKPTTSTKDTIKAACSRSFFKPMLILMVVMINLQVSGINALSFYSQDIFEQGFSGIIDPFLMTVVMDCIRCLACLIICFIGSVVPRNITFSVANLCVIVFNYGLVACFAMEFKNFVWIPVTCLIMFIFFSGVVMSTGWTYVPELLPTNARGLGSGLNSSFSFISLFISVKIIPDLMNSFGALGVFAYFGTTTLICGVILSFTLPETNGKTLQSIEDSYNKRGSEQNTTKGHS